MKKLKPGKHKIYNPLYTPQSRETMKLMSIINDKCTVKCKCGHSVSFTNPRASQKRICTYCGHWVYSKRETFKNEMRKYLCI